MSATYKQKMLVEHGPLETRALNREMFRHDAEQPGVKWNSFLQQCKKEEKAFQRAENAKKSRMKQKSPTVSAFLRKLQYVLNKRIKTQGGSALGIIRALFLHCDANASGSLSLDEFTHGMATFGVPVTASEVDAVFDHYADQKKGLDYRRLIEETIKVYPDVLSSETGLTKRIMGSATTERSFLGIRRDTKEETPMIKAFVKKLKMVLAKHMREVGGTEASILSTLFIRWDRNQSGLTELEELKGALRSLGMAITGEQAQELIRFYSRGGEDRKTGVHYSDIIKHISTGEATILSHDTPEEMERLRTDRPTARSHLDDYTFTARPKRKNKCKVVEAFKMRLRNKVETRIKHQGGLHHAIIREAFLHWDADLSGKLDPQELVGAVNRMGLPLSLEEAECVVEHYDLDGSGEMDYKILVTEIQGLSHGILSYIEEADVLKNLSHTIREPGIISELKADLQHSLEALEARGGPPPRQAFLEACMRVDKYGTGYLKGSQYDAVWKELGVKINSAETDKLTSWYAEASSRKSSYRRMANDMWRGSAGDEQYTPTSSQRLPHVNARQAGVWRNHRGPDPKLTYKPSSAAVKRGLLSQGQKNRTPASAAAADAPPAVALAADVQAQQPSLKGDAGRTTSRQRQEHRREQQDQAPPSLSREKARIERRLQELEQERQGLMAQRRAAG